MDDLLSKTIITIIIILLIVYGIPSIVYLITWIIKRASGNSTDANDLLIVFETKKNDLNMDYNSFSDYLLFCTYMPMKKLVFCNDGKNDEIKKQDKEDFNNAIRIFKKITSIKNFCDDEYIIIKDKSDTKIAETKVIRESKEHEKELQIMKDAAENDRHNSTSYREWIINIFSGIFNVLKLTTTSFNNLANITVGIMSLFSQIIAALAKNYVVTGFIILVIIIMAVLSILKYSSVDTTKGEFNYKANNDKNNFSPFSIYDDLVDTYSYYSKLSNNFNVSDYTSKILGNKNDENNGDETDDKTRDRVELYGGKYDNLSYIKLNNLGINNINDGSKDIIKTEKDKYYNIYLPSEKFKDTDTGDTNLLSWNVYETSKKEKIWELDCESIDTIIANGKPAFITDGNKCIINKVGFNSLTENEQDSDTPSTIFTTEYIK